MWSALESSHAPQRFFQFLAGTISVGDNVSLKSMEGTVNGSWISLLGGGVAAAATLTMGVHLSGLSSTTASAPATEPTTVYVEQPVIEIPGLSLGGAAALPPIVIAVMPAPSIAPFAAQVEAGDSAGGWPSSPPAGGGGEASPPPAGGGWDDDDDSGEIEHESGEGSDDGEGMDD